MRKWSDDAKVAQKSPTEEMSKLREQLEHRARAIENRVLKTLKEGRNDYSDLSNVSQQLFSCRAELFLGYLLEFRKERTVEELGQFDPYRPRSRWLLHQNHLGTGWPVPRW